MFHKIQSQMFNQWSNCMGVLLNAMVRSAEITGEAMDEITYQQVKAIKSGLLSSARQLCDAWKATSSFLVKAPKRRVALVTGGTGVLGTAICKKLAEASNQVVATYLACEQADAKSWQSQCLAEGYAIDLVHCDVTDYTSCEAMAEAVARKWGSIDILVNCAGITPDNTLRKMDEEHWHAVLDTNLDSVFNVTRNVVDGMIERRFGRIINISSVNGQKGQFGQTNYAAAKAGMAGFTRSLARELAARGITVNTVSPGYVATNLVKQVPEQIRQEIISKIPAGRLAESSEIAQAVAFLAAEESSYVTGSDLAVNGGLFMI
jgi:acetoacetyl-CoA reductase